MAKHLNVAILQAKRKMNEDAGNEPPPKKQRKQINDRNSGETDDEDFEPLKSVMFLIRLVYCL